MFKHFKGSPFRCLFNDRAYVFFFAALEQTSCKPLDYSLIYPVIETLKNHKQFFCATCKLYEKLVGFSEEFSNFLYSKLCFYTILFFNRYFARPLYIYECSISYRGKKVRSLEGWSRNRVGSETGWFERMICCLKDLHHFLTWLGKEDWFFYYSLFSSSAFFLAIRFSFEISRRNNPV